MARDGITRTVSDRTGKVSYRARVSFTDASGARRHRSKSFHTKAAAQRWRREQLAALDRGDYFEAPDITVGEVARAWLADVKRDKAPSTAMHYRRWYERVVEPAFGTHKVASVTPQEIQGFYDELAERYAPGTVGHVHKIIRGIFGRALNDGFIRSDPTDRRRIPKDQRDPPQVFTPEEARRFTERASADRFGTILIFMLATGVRIGEALALHWADVDLDARTARIHRTAQRGDAGWHISDRLKTKSSERTVVIPAVAIMALRRQQRSSVLVFPHPVHGGLCSDARVRGAMERVCRAADVPLLTPHALRRTCASLMLRNGVNVKVAAQQLGHSVEMMLTRYAAVTTDMQDMAADAVDRALGDG